MDKSRRNFVKFTGQSSALLTLYALLALLSALLALLLSLPPLRKSLHIALIISNLCNNFNIAFVWQWRGTAGP